MIFIGLFSIIILVFSYIFYRQRQYHIAKILTIVGIGLMVITAITLLWAITRPYP